MQPRSLPILGASITEIGMQTIVAAMAKGLSSKDRVK